MSLESTVRQLEAAGIQVPARVENALGVMFAARNARGVRYDAASELTAALTGGALTPDNFVDSLRNALVKQVTTAPGPSGAALWQAAEAVERVAENQVRQWLASEFDSFLGHFGEQFDQAAEALAKALPLALNPGATPQEILKGGQRLLMPRPVSRRPKLT